ncbi:MAG: hypothetical protein N3A56_07540 [Thermodesulfobacteriaceae bacterium]|nr:hypothetical protein [Thermodesulfobacteriaceae bacterium]
MKPRFWWFFILLNFIFSTTLLGFSNKNSFQEENLLKKWFEEESFFISLENYKEKSLERKNFNLLGTIKIKEKLYKSENSKIKVRVIWGEELISGWENLLYRVLKVPKHALKEIKVKDVLGYLYKKSENKHSIIFPIFKDSRRAFLICFDFNQLSLNESLSILERFPVEKFFLGSGS